MSLEEVLRDTLKQIDTKNSVEVLTALLYCKGIITYEDLALALKIVEEIEGKPRGKKDDSETEKA